MRIADKMAYDQVNKSISQNRTEMASLQNQAATQKRVNKPSDDPVAASRVLSSRVEQRSTEQFIKNLNYAKSFLDFSEQSLGELTEVLVRAKELAISQSNDAGASAQSRRIVAEEVKQLHNQAIQIANRKLGERFIFGGFMTNDAPFNDLGGYNGDDGEMKIHVDKESFLSMNLPGSVIFEGKGLSRDGFNYKSLRQPHNYKELLKQQEELPPLRGPASVRTTENAAPLQNEDEINFIPQAQGVNIFRALKKMEVALMTDDKTGIQESMDRLDDAFQQVVVARSALGSRVNTIDNTLNSMHTNIVDTKANISQLEDADAFEVISNINKTEGTLQATLQTSGRLMQKSLMDFIS
ncbi:MAG: flagellar hook-associated protein 3 [Bdellovibrionales bacterium RBG_16_40_8]|nr:MAG: flagellar hook-associated protein 3 [Bdellovibrionales bacterium RBG_16_40_8]